jgi:hypothetical protein
MTQRGRRSLSRKHFDSGSALRLVVLTVLAVTGTLGLGVAASVISPGVAGAASPCADGGPGIVRLAGSAWLDGLGVDVCSNGGSDADDFGDHYTNGVLDGEMWQCVELVDRLYLTRGWITSTWWGDGDTMAEPSNVPRGLVEQNNGAVTYLDPGDVLSLGNPAYAGGHVAVVNSVSGSTVTLVNQNAVPVFSQAVWSDRTLSMIGWAGWYVIGVVHAPVGPSGPPPRLTSNLLSNASWDSGHFGPWRGLAVGGGQVNYSAYEDPALAEQGNWYGVSNTSTVGGSIYQDVPVSASTGQSYTFSIWVRSPSGAPISGTLALWACGNRAQNDSTSFTVGGAWTLVSVPLDITVAGLTLLRAQVYEATTGQNYAFDGATFAPGDVTPYGPLVAAPVIASSPPTPIPVSLVTAIFPIAAWLG